MQMEEQWKGGEPILPVILFIGERDGEAENSVSASSAA
jgi:hypothetical protein